MAEGGHKPDSVPAFRRAMIIPLVPQLPTGSSGQPESIGRAALIRRSGSLSYLALLRVGFTVPPMSP